MKSTQSWSEPLLSPRERMAWLAGFLLIAALLVATRFQSDDADSVRYATISSVLSTQPVMRWIAPEWWGLSPDNPLTGYFQEHPAGLFFIPAFLGKIGIPRDQAPYIFGVGVGLVALLLTAQLIGRLSSREHGRAALVLLQIMPVAFVFRVRDNHEYPMLVCLLVTLFALDRLTRSWYWSGMVALGFTAAMLIKGVFVAPVMMGAALWIVVNPTRGSRTKQIIACAIAIAAMAITWRVYDFWYDRATGAPFWSAYWQRQMAPLEVASPFSQAWTFVQHIFFYVGRLLFHPAPWSLALVWAAFRRRIAPLVAPLGERERDALRFVVLYTLLSVVLLSLASRFAERYIFSATYLVAAIGVVAACRYWPVVMRTLSRIEAAVPAFPVVVWVILVGSRLLLGDWLPRIQLTTDN
jgi:4-amino-4-deoxy-L-arabinose transferase-like glycosyltransferase